MDAFLDYLTKKQILGTPAAYMGVVEFQKRGLPHMHMLIILKNEDKPRTAEIVDQIVSAELPDPDEDPELFDLVSSLMIHKCGEHLSAILFSSSFEPEIFFKHNQCSAF